MVVFFDDLDTDPNLAPSKEELKKQEIRTAAHIVNGGESKVECWKCRGSGKWRGAWFNNTSYTCHTCKGTGTVTSRQVSAAKGRETKRLNWSEWCAANVDLIEGLRRHRWNAFLVGLHDQIFEGQRILSDRQIECAREAIARYDIKRSEKRVAEETSRSTEIGLSAIEALFKTATNSGLKNPMFRAERVAIKQSKHPGVLYVYDRGVGGERGGYAGKIVEGKYIRTRDANPALGEELRAVAADPVAAARSYGLSTGTCCMCGRTLTDPSSVKAGIGPDCASNWGL